MKLLKALALLFLVASVVNSVPTNDDALVDNMEDGDQSDEEMHIENVLKEMQYEPETDVEANNHEGVLAEEDGDDDEAQLEQVQGEKAAKIAQNNRGLILHGDTIALQTFVRNRYLSCAGSHCDASTCPRMDMAGRDWSRCWGGVFRIYRQRGRGAIVSGDRVALYYPKQSGRWLGCAGSKCGKAPCPGVPNPTFGFSSSHRWTACWGEVFRIYARNKINGRPINSDDDVALFYQRSNQWVSQGYGVSTVKSFCLGRSLPPHTSKFDVCGKETFRLWKRTTPC